MLYENNSLEEFQKLINENRSRFSEEEIQYIYYKVSVVEPSYKDSLTIPMFSHLGNIVELMEVENDLERANLMLKDSLLKENLSLIERMTLRIKFNKDLTNADIEFLKTTNTQELSEIELHQFIHLILSSSLVFAFKVQTQLCNASSDYALSILTNDPVAKHFKAMRAEAFGLKAKYFLEEEAIYGETIDECIQIAMNLFEEVGRKDESIFLDLFFKGENVNNYAEDIEQICSLKIKSSQKNLLILNRGFDAMHINSTEARNYFKQYIESQDSNNPSNWLVHLAKVYLAHVEKELNNYKEAISLLDEVEEDIIESNKLQSKFYLINAKLSLYPMLDRSLTASQKLSLLKEHRAVADSLFYGESEHLEDYYVMNLVQILELYDSSLVEDRKIINSIISLVEETKKREINRFRYKEEATELMNNTSLKDMLLQCNDFKNLSYNNPKLYEDLYLYSLNNYEIGNKDKVFDYSDLPFHPEKVQELIINKNIQIVNFLYFDDYYYGYLLNENYIRTFQFESTYLDSIANVALVKLPDYYQVSELEVIKTYFHEQIGLDSRKEIYFLLDGAMYNFPIHLLVSDAKRVSSLNDILNAKEQTIANKSLSLFSYSGPDIEKHKGSELELAYSYSECELVAEELGLEDYDFYYGLEADKENLKKCFKSKIVHLSTHGMSLLDSRYNNFLLTRTDDQKGENKFYSFELDSIELNATFVFLSACDSGLGKFYIGSQTYSMANALLRNRVDAVIYTLWKVNDQVARDFSVCFYNFWKTGLTANESLVRTRLKFKNDRRYSMHDWSGFVIEGNGELVIQD